MRRTTVDGRPHLKLTLLNPRATREDVAEVLDLIAEHVDRFTAGHGFHDHQAPPGQPAPAADHADHTEPAAHAALPTTATGRSR